MDNGYRITGADCGRDEAGAMRCTCGKCKPIAGQAALDSREREMKDAREHAFELIARADKVEIICLLAIAHAITGKEVISIGNQTKGTLKKAIKLMREAQSRHPEIPEFEIAIQYIRQFIQAGKGSTV